jgi:hypothetical protein
VLYKEKKLVEIEVFLVATTIHVKNLSLSDKNTFVYGFHLATQMSKKFILELKIELKFNRRSDLFYILCRLSPTSLFVCGFIDIKGIILYVLLFCHDQSTVLSISLMKSSLKV